MMIVRDAHSDAPQALVWEVPARFTGASGRLSDLSRQSRAGSTRDAAAEA